MTDKPSIAVVGVGAIGGAMAAALGDAGHQPLLCVRTPFERLSRRFDGETRTYTHRVCTSPGELRPADWVVLCTKAHQIEGAADWLHCLIGPHTRVAVMQNGVDHIERVSAYVSPERVVPCIIFLPSKLEAPGVVEQARAGRVQVPEGEIGQALAELFGNQPAIRIVLTAGFVSTVWSKLVSNAVGGAICALAIRPLKSVAAPEVRELATRLMAEIMRVGEAEGACFPDNFIDKTLDNYRGPTGEHWTSIAVDRRDGRPMEWQARNAVVGEIGRRHGIPTPLNDALTALLAVSDAPPE